MKQLSLSERIARAEGAVECERIMSRHAYYHSGGIHREEFFGLWSKSEKITWAHGFGQWNRAQYFENYVLNQESSNWERFKQLWNVYPELKTKIKDTGKLADYRAFTENAMHVLATPVIEVSADGKSAQALWTTPGIIISTLTPQQTRRGTWMYERYGADFVFEDNTWKYLNLRVCPDCSCPMTDAAWYKPKVPLPDGAAKKPVNSRHVSERQIPGPLHAMMEPTLMPMDPGIPMPHETQSDIRLYSDVHTLDL